jgi:osmoprotectant transport system substrate-binding protein
MSSTRRWSLAVLVAVFALIAGVLPGCGSSNPLGGGEISGDLKSITVGSADFTESKIIAELYAQALEANGFTVRRQFGIGSRETYIPAVQDHSIDLIPEYTGNLLQYFDEKTPATTPDAVLLGCSRRFRATCRSCIRRLRRTRTPSPSPRRPRRSGISSPSRSREALTRGQSRAPSISDPRDRPGGFRQVRFDIAPANFVAISDGGGPATVQALTGGTVTAANIFSTAPSIEENHLVVLEDPKNTFLAANVVPLVASQKMSNELKTVLDAVSAKLTTEALIKLNTDVEGNKGVDPDEAAGKWIKDNGFDKPVQK